MAQAEASHSSHSNTKRTPQQPTSQTKQARTNDSSWKTERSMDETGGYQAVAQGHNVRLVVEVAQRARRGGHGRFDGLPRQILVVLLLRSQNTRNIEMRRDLTRNPTGFGKRCNGAKLHENADTRRAVRGTRSDKPCKRHSSSQGKINKRHIRSEA